MIKAFISLWHKLLVKIPKLWPCSFKHCTQKMVVFLSSSFYYEMSNHFTWTRHKQLINEKEILCTSYKDQKSIKTKHRNSVRLNETSLNSFAANGNKEAWKSTISQSNYSARLLICHWRIKGSSPTAHPQNSKKTWDVHKLFGSSALFENSRQIHEPFFCPQKGNWIWIVHTYTYMYKTTY